MRISDWSSDVCSSDLRPPTSWPSSQHSILCACPLWKSDRHACSIGLLIQLSGRSGAASAQARRMAGNAWSAVTRNLSERIVLRSDRDKCSPLNGRIARLFGSTQKISRSEEHTSELQSLMRISYAVFCLKKKKTNTTHKYQTQKNN